MPLYRYVCPTCKVVIRKLRPKEEANSPLVHQECDSTCHREGQTPAMHHMEVIDNGAMGRRVERFVDVEKLVHERAQKDYRKPE